METREKKPSEENRDEMSVLSPYERLHVTRSIYASHPPLKNYKTLKPYSMPFRSHIILCSLVPPLS